MMVEPVGHEAVTSRRKPYIPFVALENKVIRRVRHQYAFRSLLLICVSFAIFLLLQPWGVSPAVTFAPATPFRKRAIGHTIIGTPILPLPRPYGTAAPVMVSVLRHVRQYLRGGSHLSLQDLYSSVDASHLHGAYIGHFPDSHIPFWTPTPFNFSEETVEMKQRAHTKSSFNKVRSDSLPLDRAVPDPRPAVCQDQWYYHVKNPRIATETMFSRLRSPGMFGGMTNAENWTKLPSASVVIIFHNEHLSTLLRSVHGVLNRSPRHVLHEIILVDDGSDEEAPWLLEGGVLEQHLQLLPKTFLARLYNRNGLMRARNVGASLATGDVLVYLDSHVETVVGWLEPLVGRIAEGRRDQVNHVVVPAIDNIEADTFEFLKGGIDILGHTWGLNHVGVPNHHDLNSPDPMASPIMAGGLLAISREYFDRLGFYDPEMELWGGEEMEISFRIWLCGGTLECLPCSRVGHVFRSSAFWTGQVYEVPGEIVARNKQRASFWMDEYTPLSRLSSPPLGPNLTLGSMKFYHDIQQRLRCKKFRWYLENVNTHLLESANQLLGPSHDTGVEALFQAQGYLRNPASEACLDHLHLKKPEAPFGAFPCHYLSGSQSVVFTWTNLIMSGERLVEGCLTREDEGRLRQRKCSDAHATSQKWVASRSDNARNTVLLEGEGKCLTVVKDNEINNKSPFSLRMMPCGGLNAQWQEWLWEKFQRASAS